MQKITVLVYNEFYGGWYKNEESRISRGKTVKREADLLSLEGL